MGNDRIGEPSYPSSEAELKEYCDRCVNTLVKHLNGRLVSVLLCGSWARNEAKPSKSDVDLVFVVDEIDDKISKALVCAWKEANIACAIVVDLVEIKAKPRELMAMLCDEKKVLYGEKEFMPSRMEIIQNIADSASEIGFNARAIEYWHWEPVDKKMEDLKFLIRSKYQLPWLLKNLMAFRKGQFPSSTEQLKRQLDSEPEKELFDWRTNLSSDDYENKREELARTLSIYAHKWLKEISE